MRFISRHPFLLITAISFSLQASPCRAEGEMGSAPTRFEQVLMHVYAENPRLQSERTALKMTDEKVSQANAGFRPTLSANLAQGRQRIKTTGTDWNYGEAASGSLVLTQPLFSGFGTLEQKRAAESRVLAGRAQLLGIEQNILFTAINDWLELCEKQKILSRNEENLQRLGQYQEATKQRFKAGDGTQTDVSQAESRYAQAEARFANALAARDSARDIFERDTGVKASLDEFPNLPLSLPDSRESAEQLAGGNPSLVQAAQEQQAAEHDIGTAESSLWPKVYLQGSMNEERSPTLGLNTLRNDVVTINVSIPLYQGGGEYSRIREAKLARERSRVDAIDIARNVRERAQLSWNNYQAAQTVIEASQRALASSTRALEGVQEEQRQGLRTLTEVLDQQAERLSSQVTEIQAQKNVRVEAYRLLAATGRLTADGLGLQVDRYDPAIHHDDVAGEWFGVDARN